MLTVKMCHFHMVLIFDCLQYSHDSCFQKMQPSVIQKNKNDLLKYNFTVKKIFLFAFESRYKIIKEHQKDEKNATK